MAQRTIIRTNPSTTIVQPTTVIRTSGIGTPGPEGPAGPAGPTGPQGPPGAGSSGNLTFSQALPSTTWTIPHTLGFYPNVSTFDSTGDEIEGNVTHSSIAQVVVTFSDPVSGEAYLS